jgi:hypothetical protein
MPSHHVQWKGHTQKGFFENVEFIFVVAYFGLTMYAANQDQRQGVWSSITRVLLYLAPSVVLLLGLFALALAGTSNVELPDDTAAVIPEIGTVELIVALGLSVGAAVLMWLAINAEGARERIERWIGSHGEFNAASVIHTTALVLSLLLLTGNTVLFLLGGGVEGLAESIEAQQVNISSVVLQALLQIIAALLGVGYAIRRSLPQALARLGLRWPTREDWRAGILGGLLALGLLYVFSIVLALFIDEATLAEQNRAAESIAQQFTTIPLALLLAASASFGEEIFFRGALQPIFGGVVTSVFFTLMHTQLLLSPSIIVIFIVSMIFARLRSRHSTSAAIIAHFFYNFILLALSILLTSLTGAV